MALYAFMSSGISYAAQFDPELQRIEYADEFGEHGNFAVQNGPIASTRPITRIIQDEVEAFLLSSSTERPEPMANDTLKLTLTPERLRQVIMAGLDALNGIQFENELGDVVNVTETQSMQGREQKLTDAFLIEIERKD